MKTKTGKTIIIIVAAILVLGIAIAVFCVSRHNAKYISKAEALDIALKDAGLDTASVFEQDCDFEKGTGCSYYDIEFDASSGEYEYKVNAETGEILYSACEP